MTRADRTDEPLRTCIGCRRRVAQRALVRVTRRGGTVEVGGPSAGRGAWLCRDDADGIVARACLDAALAAGGFERAWRTPLSDEERSMIARSVLDGDGRPDAR